jgi:hypothetical protein
VADSVAKSASERPRTSSAFGADQGAGAALTTRDLTLSPSRKTGHSIEEAPRYAARGVGPSDASTATPPPAPRAFVLVVAVVIGVLTGRAGPGHGGPGRHGTDTPAVRTQRSTPARERPAGQTRPSAVRDRDGQQP